MKIVANCYYANFDLMSLPTLLMMLLHYMNFQIVSMCCLLMCYVQHSHHSLSMMEVWLSYQESVRHAIDFVTLPAPYLNFLIVVVDERLRSMMMHLLNIIIYYIIMGVLIFIFIFNLLIIIYTQVTGFRINFYQQ